MPSVVGLSPVTVQVGWVEPVNTGPEITGYVVRLRAPEERDSPDLIGVPPWRQYSVAAPATMVDITGLVADTLYEVQVQAFSADGPGEWSDLGEGSTTAAPAGNTAPAIGGAATRTFEVAENTAGGTPFGAAFTATDAEADYALAWRLTGNEAGAFAIDGSGQLSVGSFTVLDYESGRAVYRFNVEVSDGGLTDSVAVTVRVTDVEESVPAAPTAPTLTAGAGQIDASWTAPEDTGGSEISGYTLQWTLASDLASEMLWANATSWSVRGSTSFTITGLTGGTEYAVRVRAHNADGAGTWSETATKVVATAVNFGEATVASKSWSVNTAITAFTIPAASQAIGAVSYAATGLPAGVSMSSARVVSGTPTGVSAGTATITATDAANDNTATLTFGWRVLAATCETSDLLCAIMVAGSGGQDHGYEAGSYGSLSARSFTHGASTYQIHQLYFYAFQRFLHLGFSQGNPQALKTTPLQLVVNSITYQFSSIDSNNRWQDATGIYSGNTYTVRIVDPDAATAPDFGGAEIPGQNYTVGTAIDSETLPAATGGSGALSYSLTPEIADTGLSFDTTSRVLSGTPDTSQAATSYTWTVTDSATPPVSAALSFSIAIAPDKPATPTAVAGDGEVTLSITLPSDSGVEGYTVELSSDGGTTWGAATFSLKEKTETTAVYRVTELTNDTAYEFRVKAAAGLGSGNPVVSVASEKSNIATPTGGASLTLSAPTVTVTEAAGDSNTATYTVALSEVPSETVTVSVSSDDTNVATVSPASLTFTTADWSEVQTVTVTGVDDDIDNATDRTATITNAASGGGYNNISATVVVTATDDDNISCVNSVAVPDQAAAGLIADCEALLVSRDTLVGAGTPLNWALETPIADWDGVTVFGGRVAQLKIQSSGLTGTIPAELGKLTNLAQLWLYRNSLTGAIPVELGNLTNLTLLHLYSNSLTGAIPAELGKLTNLTQLWLYNNSLTGAIPVELGNLTNLTNLWLNDNSLTGAIPVELGNLTNLTSLWLYNNSLTGAIPAELGNLTNLTQMELGTNSLTGAIPAGLGKLTNLTKLFLYGSNLTGTIPVELGKLTKLTTLSLSANSLTGAIPVELGNLTNLTHLYMTDNSLTGEIPLELTKLVALKVLWLDENDLSGCTPAGLVDISNLQTDALPVCAFVIDVVPSSVTEGDPSTEVTVTAAWNGEYSRQDAVEAVVSVTGDTATVGDDFTAVDDFTIAITGGASSGTGTFTMTVTDDDVAEPDGETISVAAEDTELATSTPTTLTINDAARLIIDPASLTVAEASGTGTYTVKLSAEPSDDVTVSVTSGDSKVATVSPASLTFATDDWDTTQTVTVTGVDDAIDNATDRTATLTHSATDYADVTVAVTATDDEATPTVTLVLTPASISEDGGASGASTVTASLDHGSAAVTTVTVSAVPVDPAVAGDFILSSEVTLSIAAEATASTGTVTLTAVDNAVGAADKTVTVSGMATNAQGVTNPTAVTLTITDDDTAGVPTAPTLTATGGDGQVTLSWTAGDDGGNAITRHEYQQKAGTADYGDEWTVIATSAPGEANATSFTVTGLTNDTDYSFKVRAVNAIGGGAASEEDSATPMVVVNSAPVFSEESTTRLVAENTATGMAIGAAVTATDADGDNLTYSLGGTDVASFAIVEASGQVQTSAALDYETKSSYEVTVTATDPSSETDSITVTIGVTNVDEAGAVSFDSTAPQVGTALTASLTDPDGGVSDSDITWQWSSSATSDGTFTAISGATTAAYTPVAEDEGDYLRATASYTDDESSGKNASAVTAAAVVAATDEGPSFGNETVEWKSWTIDTAITAFTVPAATGGSGTVTYAATGLPAGVTMSAAREVAGTPSAVGTGQATVTATDAGSATATLTFDWTVTHAGCEGTDIYCAVLTTGENVFNIGYSSDSYGSLSDTSFDYGETTYTVSALRQSTQSTYFRIDSGKTSELNGLTLHIGSLSFAFSDDDGGGGSNTASWSSSRTLRNGEVYTVRITAPPDAGSPAFADGATVEPQSYTAGTSITSLTLPAAAGGDGALSYSLTPSATTVGLTWDASTHTLSGTPDTSQVRTSYTYTVNDADANRGAEDRDTLSLTIEITPAKPGVLSATGGDGEVTLLIVKPGDSGIEGYTVEFKLSSAGESTWKAATIEEGDGIEETVSYTVTGLTNDTAYDFRVQAVTGLASSNPIYSEVSNSVSATPVKPSEPADPDPEFGDAEVEDQSYTVGMSTATLTLPAATGGSGSLTYTLEPDVSPTGLSFDADSRGLSGTPSTSQAAREYTYTAANTVSGTGTSDSAEAAAIGPPNCLPKGVPPIPGLPLPPCPEEPPPPPEDTYTRSNTLTFAIEIAPARAPTPTATPGDGTVTLSWSKPADTGIAGWELQQDSGSWGAITPTEATEGSTTTLSHTVSSLTNGTEYSFQIRAHAGSGDDVVPGEASSVSATPSASNSAPVFSSDTATRSIAENTAAGESIGEAVTATDADSDALTYSLGGADMSSFDIVASSGQVQTKSALDYETKSSYTVTVTATDPSDATDSIEVTISVTNVDEAGAVSFDSTAPRVGTALTASVSDPDGGEESITWRWASSATSGGTFTAISGATDAAYTPVSDDVGNYLRATVSYTDDHGSGKTASAVTDNAVVAASTTPGAPTLTVTPGHRLIEAAWTAPTDIGTSDIVNYRLQWRPTPSDLTTEWPEFEASNSIKVHGTWVSYTITPVTIGTEYQVRVRALNDSGAGAWSDIATATPVDDDGVVSFSSTTPQVSTALTASLTDPDGGVTGETWVWASSATSGGTFAAISGATSASYTPVAGDVGNYLRATVSYTDDHGSGKTASAVTDNAVVAASTTPGAPTLTVTPGHRLIEAAWTAPTDIGTSDIVNYRLQWRPTPSDLTTEWPEFDDNNSINLHGTWVSYTITPVTNGTEYQVRVRAHNTSGAGAWSDIATATPAAATTPGAPTLTLTPGDARIDAAWVAPTHVGASAITSYTLQWRATPSDPATEWPGRHGSNSVTTSNATTVSYPITPLTNDTEYQVRVFATNNEGDGAWSDVVAATPAAATLTPGAPTLTVTPGDAIIEAAWTAPTDIGTSAITSYTLQWRATPSDPTTEWPALGGDNSVTTADATTVSYPITPVTNGTEYQVRVRAINTSGAGAWSDIATATPATPADEAGSVTFSSTTPQVSTALTASVTDPDGGVTGETWAWASSATSDGTFADISDATAASYTPVAGDVGNYLRATVSYTDDHGSGKTASAVTDNAVVAAPANQAPQFGSVPVFREVAENTPAGTNMGSAFGASDPDDDAFTFSITSADASAFEMVTVTDETDQTITGQMKTNAALDYETKSEYSLWLRVTDDGGLYSSKRLRVTITDVDEDGAVSFSSTTPTVGTAFTATLTDEDSGVTGETWVWASSATSDGTFTAISGATAASYTPVAGDVGNYLRATVSYTDDHGSGKTASAVTDNAVVVAVSDTAPAFGEGAAIANQTFGENKGITALTLPTATGGNGTRSYSLSPALPAGLAFNNSTLVLSGTPTAAVAATDYTYTVSDSDSNTGASDTDTLTFTITVTANTSPTFAESSVTRTVAENAANGTAVGAAVTATDADNDTLTYTLGGADAGLFAINSSSGQITVNGTLDFEADEERVVTVTAADGRNGTAQATVTISVTNEDEEGAVSFDSTAPRVGTALTASVSDPDGGEESITWWWASSSTSNGTFATISGATNAAYTPVSDDVGNYLKATASYEDDSSDDDSAERTASAVTDNAVVAADDNRAPVFGSDSTTRSIAENTAAATDIGDPVAATDADDDALTYSLGGTDVASFAIVAASGQLQTKSALDYETKSSYTVTVTATDTSSETDSITVTISVTNVDEAGTVSFNLTNPAVGTPLTASLTDPDGGEESITWRWASSATSGGTFTAISGATNAEYTPGSTDANNYLRATASYTDDHGGSKTASAVTEFAVLAPNSAPVFSSDTDTRSIAENTAAKQNIGAAVTATDADGDNLTYSLGGTDVASFGIVAASGQLQTKSALDYETKSSYTVTVTATDPSSETDSITVTIGVTNVDEAGTVSFDSTAPQVGTALTASVSDPDGGETSITWRWSSASTSDGTFTTISGATNAAYTPVSDDAGNHLKATASYTDDHGGSKTASAVTASAVAAADDQVPVFNPDSTAHNYTVGESIGSQLLPNATGGDGALTYTWTPDPPEGITFTVRHKLLSGTPSTSQQVIAYAYVATDSDDVDPDSATFTYSMGIAPAKAPTPTVAAGNTEATLSWTKPDDIGIDGWELGRDTGAWTGIATTEMTENGTTTLSHTVTGLSNDAVYGFRIRAHAGSGGDKVPGKGSERISVTPAVQKPAAPTELRATGGNGEVTLSWTAGDDGGSAITRHEHRRKVGVGTYGNWTPIADSAPGEANATSFTVTGLTNGTAYSFQVRAVNSVGGGAASTNEASATPDEPNSAPSFGGEMIAPQSHVVDTPIEALTLPEASGGNAPLMYLLEPDLPSGLAVVEGELEGVIRQLKGMPDTSQTARTYTWTVTDSDQPEPDSDTRSFEMEIAPAKAPTPEQVAGNTEVTLIWTKPDDTGIGGWELSRDGGSWGGITTSEMPENGTTRLSHTVTGLSNGTEYGFRIRAYAGGGEDKVPGAESGSVEATPVAEKPARPTGLTASGGDGEVTLSWTAGGDGGSAITEHQYKQKAGDDAYPNAWTSIPDSGEGEANATSHTVTGLTNGTAHTFKVRAVNDVGDGAESNEASAMPSPGNRAPVFGDETDTRSIDENTAAGENIGAAVTATDADGDTLTYTLGGADAASFAIVAASGQVQTKAALNYETKNSYTVTVTATDTSSETASITVTISVTNVDEAGSVSFSSAAPQVGTKLTAMLSDPDGGVTSITWQWSSASASTGTFTDISGATDAAYTPVADDVDNYLRATASYTDALGTVQSVSATRAKAVAPADTAPDFGSAQVAAQRYTVGVEIDMLTLPAATGGNGTLSYSLTPPAGLSFDPASRVLSGTPTTSQVTTSYTYTVNDADTNRGAEDTATLSFDITIAAAPALVSQAELQLALSAFGRVVATDAVAVIGQRMTGANPAQTQVTVGGVDVTRLATLAQPQFPGLPAGARAGRGMDLGAFGVLRQSGRDVLAGSAFALSLGDTVDPRLAGWSVWGRGQSTHFQNQAGGGTVDGEMLSGYLGVDGHLTATTQVGLAVSRSQGDLASQGASRSDVELSLTTVLPYVRWQPSPALSVWGLGGIGFGELAVTTEDEQAAETDVGLRLGAMGLEQQLASHLGINWAVKADTFAVQMDTEAVAALPAVEADVTRLRLAVVGTGVWTEADARWAPSVEVGLRLDDGTGVQGLGMEVGTGLGYTHLRLGVTVEARARVVVAHEADGFEEWGAGGTVRYDPGQPGQGLQLTLAPQWGVTSSGVEALWSRRASGLGPGLGTPAGSAGQLVAEVSYGGLRVSEAAVWLRPFTRMVLAAEGHRMSAGTRIGTPAADLSLVGERETADRGAVHHSLRLQWDWRF